jgi:hypothetical protein
LVGADEAYPGGVRCAKEDEVDALVFLEMNQVPNTQGGGYGAGVGVGIEVALDGFKADEVSENSFPIVTMRTKTRGAT